MSTSVSMRIVIHANDRDSFPVPRPFGFLFVVYVVVMENDRLPKNYSLGDILVYSNYGSENRNFIIQLHLNRIIKMEGNDTAHFKSCEPEFPRDNFET